MKSQLSRLATCVATLLAFTPAFAQRLDPITVEGPVETNVSLVAISGNAVTVRACAACESLTYQMDLRTIFLINDKVVTQAVWLNQTRASPNANAVVFYRLTDKFVTRVMVTG